MIKVRVEDAVGMVLCHDITQIIPGEFKGRAFKKGHIVTTDDIPKMLRMGKENLYVWEKKEGCLHEDEAALRIAQAVAGAGISLTEPKEGKINLIAGLRGLLKIDVTGLNAINNEDQVVLSSLHRNQVVEKGMTVAATRVIPLVIDQMIIQRVEGHAGRYTPVVEVKPLVGMRVGVVVTGSEVYKGRIEDKFSPVVIDKVTKLGCSVIRKVNVTDSIEMISDNVKALLAEGAEMILITGGMSVDPDDMTPAGVVAAGGTIVSYGAPVLPGAMFMVAYIGRIPILGLPGCVMYSKNTVLDLLLPRILAGERITRQDVSILGHGGLCANCSTCRFPSCSFGKV
ncbi:MAG: molybdopterin-binding protein [Spirochaetes bacterium]|nr:molybdopterin-binding protein [Spirochaetota bacterium]